MQGMSSAAQAYHRKALSKAIGTPALRLTYPTQGWPFAIGADPKKQAELHE
ncbi:MAG: hypothetical protein ACI92S_005032 [Planctomycetaceae bacterium]|jgi:hypothetical protein